MNLLIILEHFLLEKHKECDFEKYIPTILKFFYDEDLLSEDFLLEWESGKYREQEQKNFVFKQETNENFKKFSQQILTWLKLFLC